MDAYWIDAIPDHKREALFAWMRLTGNHAEKEMARSVLLEPFYGQQIAVGAAAFDPFIRGETAMEYLRAIRKGASPEEALKQSLAYARLCVNKHNKKRKDIDWQRWEGTADAYMEGLHGSLLRALSDARKAEHASCAAETARDTAQDR